MRVGTSKFSGLPSLNAKRQRNAGKVETIYGNLRFMSVATINKMNKASLDDWLFQRGFMPEAFDNNKEKKQVLIDDLRSELNSQDKA
tara:strand:+ start:7526 stop:7786 length:261 start_codon:yes stop_codon:yes gene_type:complete